MFQKPVSVSEFKLENYQKGTEGFEEREEAHLNIELGQGFKEVGKRRKQIKGIEEKFQKEGFLHETDKKKLIDLREDDAPLNDKQMKMFLRDIFDNLRVPELKKFAEKHCIIDLDKNVQQGVMVDTKTVPGKFVISLNPKSFYEYGQTEIQDKFGLNVRLKYFNPEKVSRLIGQALGYILSEPDDWHKFAPKIAGGKFASWQEFAGFCLAHPDEAEKEFAPGFRYFRKIISDLGSHESLERIQKSMKEGKKEHLKEGSFFYDLRDQQAKGNGPFAEENPNDSGFRRFINKLLKNYKTNVDIISLEWNRLKNDLWNTTDWYQRAIAEFDDKEVSRIITRNESIGDREKALRILLNDGKSSIGWDDQCRLRTLLLADAKTSDWSQDRLHVYLQATDGLYRKTHGEQITKDSYDFIMRVNRVSELNGKRYGTKHSEYLKILIGDEYQAYDASQRRMVTQRATKEMYVRRDYEQWLEGAALYEIANKTSREVSGMIAQETYEYCKIGKRFIGLEEYWGEGEEKYQGPMSDLEKNLGLGFANEMFSNLNHRQPTRKLGPDQIAVIARIIAEELKIDNESKLEEWGIKIQRGIISKSEHVKPAMAEVYTRYRPLFLKDAKYRLYINYFLNKNGLQTDEEGKFTRFQTGEESDEKTIADFTENKYTTEPDYKKAHQVLDEYENEFQTEPLWEKENGKYVDKVENGLRREFVFTRETEESAKDVENIKSVIEKYQKLIEGKIKASKLNSNAQSLIISLVLNPENSELRSKEFILGDMGAILELECPELFINNKIASETRISLSNLINSIRPYRREYYKLIGLLDALGIDNYIEVAKARVDYVNKDDKQAQSDENKKKWLENVYLQELSALIGEVKGEKELDKDKIDSKMIGLGLIKAKDNPDALVELSSKEIDRFTDPDGKIHPEKLVEMLQMTILGAQININTMLKKFEKKPVKPKDDKSDAEKKEQKEEKNEEEYYSESD